MPGSVGRKMLCRHSGRLTLPAVFVLPRSLKGTMKGLFSASSLGLSYAEVPKEVLNSDELNLMQWSLLMDDAVSARPPRLPPRAARDSRGTPPAGPPAGPRRGAKRYQSSPQHARVPRAWSPLDPSAPSRTC